MSTIVHHQFGGPPTLVLARETAPQPRPHRFLPRPPSPLPRRHRPPVVAPRPAPVGLKEQIACAKATAARYRQIEAMGGRPVRVIQMGQFATAWEAKAASLEARLRGRQQAPGELFQPQTSALETTRPDES